MPVTYDVERDGVVVATELAEMSLDETGLDSATIYTYRVRARDEFGLGEWSDPFDATTDSAGVTFSEDFTAADGQLDVQTSGNWTTSTGNASNVMALDEPEGNIVSNQAVLSGSGPLTSVTPILDDVDGNYSVAADLTQQGFASTTPWIALMTRWAGGVGSAQGVGLRIRLTGPSNMVTELFRIDGTSETVQDSSADDLSVAGFAMAGTLRLEVTGNSYVGLVDGVAVVSATITTHSGNTNLCVLARRTLDSANSHIVDNFSTAPL